MYRYGFNGQEHSTEIGDDSYTAEYWEYDSRIGRRWNVDPKPTAGISEYVSFFNNPIQITDKHGDTPSSRSFVLPVNQDFWPDIYRVDSKYAKFYPQYASKVPGTNIILLRFTYKKVKPNNNRTESEKAWPDVKNPNSKLYQVHECAYACTWEGGANTIREPVDKEQNEQHGRALSSLFRLSGLENRADFYVALIPSKNKKPDDDQPNIPIAQTNANKNNKQEPLQQPKVISLNPQAVETTKKVATAAIIGYAVWKVVAWGLTIATDGLASPLLAF